MAFAEQAASASDVGSAVLINRVDQLSVVTRASDMREITRDLKRWCDRCEVEDGLLTLFIRHTSASITVQENADPTVREDLMAALSRLVPEDLPYKHGAEGSDDMPAHIRTLLTGVNLAIPVRKGRIMLGRWQGVYIIEHRARPLQREVALHYSGTARSANKA